jgi:hypothetical protein
MNRDRIRWHQAQAYLNSREPIVQLSSNELGERIDRAARRFVAEMRAHANAWLDEDPPTWNWPSDTPPHVMAGLRRLFDMASVRHLSDLAFEDGLI